MRLRCRGGVGAPEGVTSVVECRGFYFSNKNRTLGVPGASLAASVVLGRDWVKRGAKTASGTVWGRFSRCRSMAPSPFRRTHPHQVLRCGLMELVGIDVEDAELRDEGMVVTVRRSKTDQDGEGAKVGIPFGRDAAFCPVGVLRAWLDVSGVAEGPVFRPVNRHGHMAAQRLSAAVVASVVKRAVKLIGLEAGKFSGHSLRAGFATSAAMANVSDRVIMRQTRHRSVRVLERYIRDGSLFRENAAAAVL